MHLDYGKSSELSSAGTAPAPISSRRQWWIAGFTVVTLMMIAGGLYAYQHATQEATLAALAAPRPPIPTEIAVASVEPVPQLLSGIGSLQAVRQVTVSPEVGGRVVKIFFQPGTKVKEGDPLLQLYDGPLRGDLATFEAQERLAARNLQRSKDLDRNYLSRQAAEQIQSTLEQVQGSIIKTRAQIDQMLVRAPFDGELGVRQIAVGAYLAPGTPVVTLTDLTTLWINFTLPEQAASEVRVGQVVNVRADAFANRTFDAKVTTIEPQISVQTRSLLVQATLSNSELVLLPGMFAKAEIVVSKLESAVVVPETAVDYSLYGEVVYVIDENKNKEGLSTHTARRVVVKTGERFDGKVTILSGLTGGERVAASGQLKLSNGAAVAIEAGSALSVRPSTEKY